jgi:hypothetical protein
MMADEIDRVTTADAPAVAEAPAPKKQRKPRAKKVALEAAPVDASTEPGRASTGVAGKQSQKRKSKWVENFTPAKHQPVKRALRVVQPAVPGSQSDDMADILQLEEENQRLRKLLAEKLRVENADLRKRLKLD